MILGQCTFGEGFRAADWVELNDAECWTQGVSWQPKGLKFLSMQITFKQGFWKPWVKGLWNTEYNFALKYKVTMQYLPSTLCEVIKCSCFLNFMASTSIYEDISLLLFNPQQNFRVMDTTCFSLPSRAVKVWIMRAILNYYGISQEVLSWIIFICEFAKTICRYAICALLFWHESMNIKRRTWPVRINARVDILLPRVLFQHQTELPLYRIKGRVVWKIHSEGENRKHLLSAHLWSRAGQHKKNYDRIEK